MKLITLSISLLLTSVLVSCGILPTDTIGSSVGQSGSERNSHAILQDEPEQVNRSLVADLNNLLLKSYADYSIADIKWKDSQTLVVLLLKTVEEDSFLLIEIDIVTIESDIIFQASGFYGRTIRLLDNNAIAYGPNIFVPTQSTEYKLATSFSSDERYAESISRSFKYIMRDTYSVYICDAFSTNKSLVNLPLDNVIYDPIRWCWSNENRYFALHSSFSDSQAIDVFYAETNSSIYNFLIDGLLIDYGWNQNYPVLYLLVQQASGDTILYAVDVQNKDENIYKINANKIYPSGKLDIIYFSSFENTISELNLMTNKIVPVLSTEEQPLFSVSSDQSASYIIYSNNKIDCLYY